MVISNHYPHIAPILTRRNIESNLKIQDMHLNFSSIYRKKSAADFVIGSQ